MNRQFTVIQGEKKDQSPLAKEMEMWLGQFGHLPLEEQAKRMRKERDEKPGPGPMTLAEAKFLEDARNDPRL